MSDALARAVTRVVVAGNCTGCGACALISPRVSMRIDGDGFSRPMVASESEGQEDKSAARGAKETFNRVCPGKRLVAPPPANERHPIFGAYVEAWQAWAVDPEIRFQGSSGGVLTALSGYLLSSGRTASVVGAGSDKMEPSRTVPIKITSREEALAAAGSRYAPVSVLAAYSEDSTVNALVGKPCEVAAAYQLHAARGSEDDRPIAMSFFCAGTPSQLATDSLATKLGVEPKDAVELRYRGRGWPGDFSVRSATGVSGTLTYDESWGKHLGRSLQPRCKICPDGTGEHADISVGDYWEADDKGFPLFEDADGKSVLIARTSRGHALVLAAVEAGVIAIEAVRLDSVAAVQPLQTSRRRTLFGRLIGKLLAGRRVPRFAGYGLLRIALASPFMAAKAAAGMFLRTLRSRR